MHARRSPDPGLRRLAALQDGVVTRAQCLGHDLGGKSLDRLVREGHWRRLATGVYLTADVEPSWRALAWAGVLIGGDHARIGGLAAAHLHGLVDRAPDSITVVVPHQIRRRDCGPWVFCRERSPATSSSMGNPPRTGVDETVLAVCALGGADEAVGWVTTAVQRRRTTPERLRRTLEGRARQPHRQLILSLIADVGVGAESPLEHRYLRDVERAHGLPRGRRQVGSRDGLSVRDVQYDEQQLIVELDGRRGHDGSGRFRDMWRDNLAVIDGWPTLRYGTADVYRRPCEVAQQVAQVLISRGWRDLPRRCRHCQRRV